MSMLDGGRWADYRTETLIQGNLKDSGIDGCFL